MAQCEVCSGRSELYLCPLCMSELKLMLRGLVVGQELPNGKHGLGFIEALEDAVLGKTRLGESARRSSERGSPLLHNERASELLDNVHEMLLRWVEAINVNAETTALPGETS